MCLREDRRESDHVVLRLCEDLCILYTGITLTMVECFMYVSSHGIGHRHESGPFGKVVYVYVHVCMYACMHALTSI